MLKETAYCETLEFVLTVCYVNEMMSGGGRGMFRKSRNFICCT